jgi:hypothetical protein
MTPENFEKLEHLSASPITKEVTLTLSIQEHADGSTTINGQAIAKEYTVTAQRVCRIPPRWVHASGRALKDLIEDYNEMIKE